MKKHYTEIKTDDCHIWFSRNNKCPLIEGLKDLECNIHSILADFCYLTE